MELLSDHVPLALASGVSLDQNALNLYFLSPNVWSKDLPLAAGGIARIHRSRYVSRNGVLELVPDQIEFLEGGA